MSSQRFTLRSAVYLFPFRGRKLLLMRRFNTGWMDGMYSLISGHLDGKESVTDSMIREAYEEAKITLTRDDLKPATVLHRKSPDEEYIDFFFVDTTWKGTPEIGEPDKCDDLSWFDIDNLPSNTLPYIKDALHNYKKNNPFFEYGWE